MENAKLAWFKFVEKDRKERREFKSQLDDIQTQLHQLSKEITRLEEKKRPLKKRKEYREETFLEMALGKQERRHSPKRTHERSQRKSIEEEYERTLKEIRQKRFQDDFFTTFKPPTTMDDPIKPLETLQESFSCTELDQSLFDAPKVEWLEHGGPSDSLDDEQVELTSEEEKENEEPIILTRDIGERLEEEEIVERRQDISSELQVDSDIEKCLALQRIVINGSNLEETNQRTALFENKCLIKDHVCSLLIDGGKLEEQTTCNVVSMEICHVLLRRTWLYDHWVIHDEKKVEAIREWRPPWNDETKTYFGEMEELPSLRTNFSKEGDNDVIQPPSSMVKDGNLVQLGVQGFVGPISSASPTFYFNYIMF